jgi:hypothetical protein
MTLWVINFHAGCWGARGSDHGHEGGRLARPPRAMCGRLRVGKENLHVAGLVGAAMCSAFGCGSHDRWP